MREVAEMLSTEAADPRLASVTISGVRMNPDLSVAEVLYTVGPGGDRAEAEAALAKAGGYLRGKLGRRLKSKFVPELRFAHDEYLEDVIYGQKPPGH